MEASNSLPQPIGVANIDRGPIVNGVNWAEVSVALVIVALRFYTRIIHKTLGVDDWLMMVAWVFFAATTAAVTKLAALGGFRHWFFLSPQQQLDVIFWENPGGTLNNLTLVPAKLSVACLILRILGPVSRWRRGILYFFMATVTVFNILTAVFIWVQCQPAAAAWDHRIRGNCWSPDILIKYAQFAAVWNVIVDFALALIPASFFWYLQMSTGRKIQLISMMSLGILAAICGIMRTVLVKGIVAADLTWSWISLHLWASSEMFLLIVCGSIPPLKKLWSHDSDSQTNADSDGGFTTAWTRADNVRSNPGPYNLSKEAGVRQTEYSSSRQGSTDDSPESATRLGSTNTVFGS